MRSEPAVGRTLVLALGNPILSDDAVGWELADRLVGKLDGKQFTILKESAATLDLLRRLEGYERLVVLDAIQLGTQPVGTLHRFTLQDFASTIHYSSAHDINFATALQMGKDFGYNTPEDVLIYGVEVKELRRFAEGCTPEVAVELDALAEQIVQDLQGTT